MAFQLFNSFFFFALLSCINPNLRCFFLKREQIFVLKRHQKGNWSSDTTGWAKWHVLHCKTDTVYTLDILGFSRILVLLQTNGCATDNMLKTARLTKSASIVDLSRILALIFISLILSCDYSVKCVSKYDNVALFICTETIVLLNSSLNLIIYCQWKMIFVRHAVKSILRNIYQSLNGP